MASILHRPGKKSPWLVRWTEHGRQRSRAVENRKAADRLYREVAECEDRGIVWAPLADVRREVAGLDAVLTDYLTAQARRVAPRTLQSMSVPLELFSRHAGAGASIGAITARALEAWYDALRTEDRPGGRRRALTTCRKYIAEVQAAWRWAWDRADEYPGVARWRNVARELRAPEATPVVAPTWVELDQVIAATRDEWVTRLAVVMRYTGLRVSQALRLRWDDLDLQSGLLTIRPELGKSRQERRGRVIPVSAHLIEHVVGWGVRDGALVVELGDRPIVNAVRDADGRLREAWAAAGVREVVWRGRPAHAFRKGVESGLLSLALPYIHVEAYLGHVVGRTEGATSGAAYVDAAALPLAAVAAAFPAITDVAAETQPRRAWVRRVVSGGV